MMGLKIQSASHRLATVEGRPRYFPSHCSADLRAYVSLACTAVYLGREDDIRPQQKETGGLDSPPALTSDKTSVVLVKNIARTTRDSQYLNHWEKACNVLLKKIKSCSGE